MITKKWRYDHWELYYNGKFICTCSDSELDSVKYEIRKEYE